MDIVERLKELAETVTQGRDAVAREFTMRVPAEPERDADLVLSRAADEIARLRSVCGEAYQMAGALGASVEALDNLSAAANGYPLPHETFLPVTESDEIARLRDENAKLRAERDGKGAMGRWQ